VDDTDAYLITVAIACLPSPINRKGDDAARAGQSFAEAAEGVSVVLFRGCRMRSACIIFNSTIDVLRSHPSPQLTPPPSTPHHPATQTPPPSHTQSLLATHCGYANTDPRVRDLTVGQVNDYLDKIQTHEGAGSAKEKSKVRGRRGWGGVGVGWVRRDCLPVVVGVRSVGVHSTAQLMDRAATPPRNP